MSSLVFKSVMIPPFSWCFSNRTDESYAVVSEYFGRGLFNKVTLITETMQDSPPLSATASAPAPTPAPAPPALNYGPGAEAKLRLTEGQVYTPIATKPVAPKSTTVVPIPEHKRVVEQTRYSSSLEANMNKLEPVHSKTTPYQSPQPLRKESRISQNISTVINRGPLKNTGAVNPFGEENYDEAKNPFADEETGDPKNPFSEDDDYDKNLNPFS